MKKMLMRPTAALFPAVLLLGMLFGDGKLTAMLFQLWLAMQICSLCSVDAFRNAAAREPGVRRVDRRFSGAWIMILIGAGICASMLYLWKQLPVNDWLLVLSCAVLIIIEQLFEERMFALSRRTDGVVLGVISNVLLLAGLMMDSSGGVVSPLPMRGFFTGCGAALGAVISIAANYTMEPMRKFSLLPRNIAFFPGAAAQSLLYPAVMIAAAKCAGVEFIQMLPNLLAGMMLWRLARTLCRRAADESRPLNLLLMLVCGALAAGAIWMPVLVSYANAAAIAMICALAVFCAPGWRVYAGAILIIAANGMLVHPLLQGEMHMAAVCAACAIAVVLNLHKAFLRKV